MITGVPNGAYTLMPSLNGYIFTPFSASVTVNNADVSGQNFTGVPVTYSISGQVLDGSGAPLAGVIISDGVRSAMSNVDGNYTIVGVPSGSYVVTPDKLGYRFEPSTRAVTIVDASATGQGFIAVAVPLPPGVITGMLYSDANYNGLYDAGEQGVVSGTLTLLHSSDAVLATVLTDETGHYTFSDAAVGAYTVQMTPPAGWVARGAVARTVSVISAATIAVDFGVQAQGSISGALFEDSNSNGVQDNGEPGTAGAVVNLLLDGTLVQTTTTDADGLYGFIGVNPGRYLVQIEAPDGYIAGIDSEQTVMLPVGGSAGASFGLQGQGSISGVIFHDRNGNQSVDPGESGIAGARVRLVSPVGGPLESTTDASGRYSFTGVATGTYHVQITPPSGWTVQGAPSRVVNLDSGAAAVSSFACQPAGAIVGAVFQDIDGDGVQAYNEPGMAGVAVYVARDGLFVANRLTDNQGVYHVDGLSAGDYLVMIAIPEGFAPVVTPSEQVARLADGLATTIGFGLQPIGVIAGVVYDDLNGDGARQASESGLAGASVSLYTAGPDGVFRTVDDVLVATASSDVEGLYRFANQPVNAYALRLLTPAGYNPTTSAEVMVNLAQFSSVVANFGNQAMGTVVATIFEDLNDNGVQDAGENPLAGAPVSVEATELAANLTTQYSAMTNIAGFAVFRNLPTGSYVVRTQAPDARYVGRITQANITVSPDEAVNRQFGFRQIGTVAGGIFTDLDGNSRQDSDEPGLGGVNVSLLDPDGALIDITITDGEGGYRFDELPGGDFQIQITPPDGYLLTSPNPVPFVLADEGPDAAETVSVGVVSAANVYGRVFADMNKNGVRDVGENGIGGVAVILHDPYAQQRSVRTTGSGLFLVTAVLYGASDVAIALPPYHEAITPDRVSLVVDGVHAAVARFALYPRQPNQAPVMEAIPDQVYDAGDTVSIQVVATDPDDSWLTYDATGLPQGVTIDADSGLIAGQIAHAEHGEYLVTATVSDPLKASDQQSFLITVNRTEEVVFLYLPIIMNHQKLIFMPIILNHQQILFMPLLFD